MKPSNNSNKHREWAAIKLGRPLWEGEVVHHIDLNHNNNDLSNLHICDKDRHLKAHKSMALLAAELLKAGIIHFDEESSTYYADEKFGIVVPDVDDARPKMSQREQIVLIKKIMKDCQNDEPSFKKGVPYEAIRHLALKQGVPNEDRLGLLFKRLGQNGEIYKTGDGKYLLAPEVVR